MPVHPVISGAFDTSVGQLRQFSCMDLHIDAAVGALADAGLEPADIDGVLCAYSLAEPHPMLASWFCEQAGIHPGFCASLQAGGATACVMLMQAAALVQSGQCRHVLLVTGDNRLSGMTRDGAVAALAGFGHPDFEMPWGMSIPAAYALVAQRYLHEFGTTSEQLAAIAVEQRRHAARHPKAQMRDLISIEDVLASPFIAEPLHLLDCCLISDGGAALVVSRAGEGTAAARDVAVLGSGQGHTHEHLFAAPSLTSFGCAASAARAFEQARTQPAGIDVAEIYDSFTITLLVELESMGFFPKGHAGMAALEGQLGLAGSLPCNTHGGLLSYAHSGAAGGMFHLVEAVHQLRHEAGARQVKDAQLAFVHGDGGVLSAHCSHVLGAPR
jgi:acetyl-CoA acetyltransferase